MGLFSFMKRENPQPVITPPVSDALLSALMNNEVITREKAMTLPAVCGAVDLITNTIASMPVKLYKHKDGKVEEQDSDVRVKMLNGDTGDTLDSYQMKKAMVEDYLMGKGGYMYIERFRNEVISLRYVEEIYITILKNFKPIYKDFVILVMGEQYKPYDFVKLLRNTKDGASGVGLTVEVSKALETAYDTLVYQLGQVKSGGNRRGFLQSQRKLGQDEIDVLKEAWKRMYSDKAENVVVLNNGLEFKEASNTAVDMQLDQNKQTLQKEINNIFHIHPDDFWLTFKEAIYPIVKAFETALNRDLLLEKEKKHYFFEFDVKEIVKANLSERYEAYKLAKETGFMTLNEIRRAENMEYVEGLDVINVGLGAVLYDTNKHIYYTPNTDTIGNVGDADTNIQKLIEDKELDQAFEESGNSAERFNDNHDAKTGQFAPKNGGGSGGGSSNGSKKISESEKQAKLDDLQKQFDEAKGIFAKAKIKNQMDMLKEGFEGTQEEYLAQKKAKQEEAVAKAKEKQQKEKEEYEKNLKEKAQKEYEEYGKYKDDKIESKSSEEKINDLKAMREKYDNDADFEASFTKLYHGGSKESVNEIGKNVEVLSVNEKEEKYGDVSGGNIYGLSTATSAKSAKTFSESRGNKDVAELYLSKNAKVYELKDKHIDDMTYKDVNEILKQGYDAINVGGDENEMRILNPNVVFTKSQVKSAEGKGGKA